MSIRCRLGLRRNPRLGVRPLPAGAPSKLPDLDRFKSARTHAPQGHSDAVRVGARPVECAHATNAAKLVPGGLCAKAVLCDLLLAAQQPERSLGHDQMRVVSHVADAAVALPCDGRSGRRIVTRPARGVPAGRATTCFPSRPPHKLTSNSSAPQWQQPVCVTIRARREGGHGGGKGRPRSSFSIAETLALLLALGLSLCPFPTGWSKDAKTSMQKWCGLSGR